ncbi:YybS family protein [Candidatus Pseudomonas adelgestsugas]|uniref:DUF2232 domain-containing protein n=1 Tax=Candidatus Pseudomonas adelgestsugas TaxID=1302376 RepID=A0ABX5R851_9PSED|nr:hypothetical protein [Candidatus Pseudomonas adelgestsugas]QAX81601.1 hypothetical protein C3B55_00239 [Candidatus Pseudomonas adelgestsugas]
MRALAEFIMHSRVQAALVVAGCVSLPLFYWLGAAAGCLILLKYGLKNSFGVLSLGLLSALIWWLQFSDPRVLLVLLGSSSLALVLRASESWVRTLLVSVALGLIYSVILSKVFCSQIEALSQEIIKILPMIIEDFYRQLLVGERARLALMITPILTGLIAALLQFVSVLSLILGRYWQAVLYNPGGFSREFYNIRLPVELVMLLLVCIVSGLYCGSQLVLLALICSVPLVFAGLALIHGLVAQKYLAKFWLVGLYVTFLLFMQLIYPLLVILAIFDGLIDFRSRLTLRDADNSSDKH